jgi:hypothetical protein
MAATSGPLGSVILGTLPLGAARVELSSIPLPIPPYIFGICAEADYLVSRLDAAVAKYQPLTATLQRLSIDSATGATFVAKQVADFPAFIKNFVPQDLEAGEVQDIRVVMSPRWLSTFGMPERDDRVIIDGNPSNVEQIGALKFCGQVVHVNLLCRG